MVPSRIDERLWDKLRIIKGAILSAARQYYGKQAAEIINIASVDGQSDRVSIYSIPSGCGWLRGIAVTDLL